MVFLDNVKIGYFVSYYIDLFEKGFIIMNVKDRKYLILIYRKSRYLISLVRGS